MSYKLFLYTKRGLEIHGLLVGKNTSVPLGMICTDWDGVDRIHNFLCKYDPFNLLLESKEKDRMKEKNANINGMSDDLTFQSESINYDNVNINDNDLNDQKYRKIKDFKSISEKLSENFEVSTDFSSKKKQQPHISKYNKKQPKLKSGTQLYALPKNFEENYNSEIFNNEKFYCKSNYNYQKNRILRNNKMVLYASKTNSISELSITEFEYIKFLKRAQKIALIEIEKEEKNSENNLFLHNSNSENREEGEIAGNVEKEGNDENDEKQIGVENGENGSYRGLLRDSLKVLSDGLIERDVEVRTCVVLK